MTQCRRSYQQFQWRRKPMRMCQMTNENLKSSIPVTVPGQFPPEEMVDQSVLLSTVRKSLEDRAKEPIRHGMFRKATLGTIVVLLLAASSYGCQSAVEKASATDATATATTNAEPAKAAPAVVPTTAAEPTAKPAVPVPAITEGIVTAAKAAFESNKCGTCHFVGAFPAVKPATAKNDLGGIGITRSSVWISNFLQKKEKVDGKFHMKTFAGTPAERDVLAQWLAAQKAEPLPAKPSGAK